MRAFRHFYANISRLVSSRRLVERCKGVFDQRDYLNKMRHYVRDASFESSLHTSLRQPDVPLPLPSSPSGLAKKGDEEGRNNLSKEGTSVSLTKRTTRASACSGCRTVQDAPAIFLPSRRRAPRRRRFMRLDGRTCRFRGSPLLLFFVSSLGRLLRAPE